jgi:hypothetical protein
MSTQVDELGSGSSILRLILKFSAPIGQETRRTPDGQVGWKATPLMLQSLNGAEREAEDDWADFT